MGGLRVIGVCVILIYCFHNQGKPSAGPRVTFGRDDLFDTNPEVHTSILDRHGQL